MYWDPLCAVVLLVLLTFEQDTKRTFYFVFLYDLILHVDAFLLNVDAFLLNVDAFLLNVDEF